MLLINFGPLNIFIDGILLALSFLISSFWLWKSLRERGIEEDKIFDANLMGTTIFFIVSRLFYIFTHIIIFNINIMRWIHVFKFPGMNFEIGLISLLPLILFYAKKWKIKFNEIMDDTVYALLPAIIVFNLKSFRQIWLILLIVFFIILLKFRSIWRKEGLLFFLLANLRKLLVYLIPKGAQMLKIPTKLLKSIQTYLSNRHKDIEEKIANVKKEDPFADADRLNDNAAMDTDVREEVGHERAEAIKLELMKNLARVRKAMTKIKIGKYGICEKCGKMIDTDRLGVMPDAEFCVKCENKNEKEK